MRHLLRALHYLRPYWRLAVTSAVLTVLAALSGLLAPWPLKIIVDNVLGTQPLPGMLTRIAGLSAADKTTLLMAVVVGSLVITLLHHGITVLQSYVTTSFEQRMILDFRGDIFAHAQRLSMAFHDQSRAGALIYAINFQAARGGEGPSIR